MKRRCIPIYFLASLITAGFGINDAVAAPARSGATAPAPLRDPTQPPASVSIRGGSAQMVAVPTIMPQHIVRINGRTYLLWHSRRYAVGDTLDGGRLERITESEVWLRRASGLQKISIFTGIEKRPPSGDPSANTATRTIVDGKKGSTK